MRLLNEIRTYRAGVRRIIEDGITVSRIRTRFLLAGLPVSDLTDVELERALAQGLYDELLCRSHPAPVIHVKGTIKDEAAFAEKVTAHMRQIPCTCGHTKARHDSPSGDTACLRCDCKTYRPDVA